MLTLDRIYLASHVLKSVIRRTDLIAAPGINPDSEIYLKPKIFRLLVPLKCVVPLLKFLSSVQKKKRMV